MNQHDENAIPVLHTFIHMVISFSRNRYRIQINAFLIIFTFYGVQKININYKRERLDIECIK